MAKDRSFASKVAKADKHEEIVQTALIIKPIKAENGHYKFKRILTKLTDENKKAHGV